MQAISEILTGIQTPAETGAGASSRPMMDGYNELTQWANDAINANSWRISPDQVLSGESERLLLELVAENNRRLRETQQEVAENSTERLLKRHRLETLEVIAAYLKLRLEQNRKESSTSSEEELSAAGQTARTGSPSLPLTSSSRCSEICTTDAAIRGTKTLTDTGDAGSASAPSGAASTPSRSGPLAAATLKA